MGLKRQNSGKDSEILQLEIVEPVILSSGITYSSTNFIPQPPRDPTPISKLTKSRSTIQAPEKKVTLFALRLAVLEKLASGLGKLSFAWATVVLLGGFATLLKKKDFVYITIILVSEGTRIFGRSHELEWQHHATWSLAEAASHYSFRALKSSGHFVFNAVKCVCPIFVSAHDKLEHQSRSLKETDSSNRDVQGQIMQSAQERRWSASDVKFIPYSGLVLVSRNISALLAWLQIASAVSCITLSMMRLVSQDYGEEGPDTENRNISINLFYGLALAEALLFLMERAYWTWRISYCNLLENVCQECELGVSGVLATKRFFYDSFSKCIEGSIFDGLKMDLVNFAKELLDSEFQDEQMMGARILQSFVKGNQYSADTLRKIGTSTWVIERLVEMLSWKDPTEEEIRKCAAEIVHKLAGKKQNALRVAAIPASMESISSMLYTGRNVKPDVETIPGRLIVADKIDYEFSAFNLLGLGILKKLACDDENCAKIGNTKGLLPKIIDLSSAGERLLRNDRVPDSQIKQVKKALQLVKKLSSRTGKTGKILRREISEIVFTVSNIRDIIQHGDNHMVLQKLGIEILSNLALDEDAKEKIGGTGGIIGFLSSLFFRPGFTDFENAVSNEAGEALAMLALNSKTNCDRILKDPQMLSNLIGILNDPVLRLNASRILRNIFATYIHEHPESLSGVKTALPTVLKAIMEASGKLLEVSIGLAVQICNYIAPKEFSEALEKASIKETDLVKKLANILKQYHYPDMIVPRIRKYVIELTIWMIKSNKKNIRLFKDVQMEKLLNHVAQTTSELESYHLFSGTVGLCRHATSVSSLVDTALELMAH